MKPRNEREPGASGLKRVADNLQKAYPKDYQEREQYSVKKTALEEAMDAQRSPTMLCCWRLRALF